MKKFIFALILTGCGEPFSTTLFHAPDAPDGDVVDAPQAAGGTPSSGGAASTGGSGTGGRVVRAGGASTGGADTGGTVSSTGGAQATGGSPSVLVDAGCAPVTHDNGLGQTWQDCVPLYTYDEAQAMKACKASGAPVCIKSERCGPGVYEVQGFDADRAHLIGEWGYGNFAEGYVSPDYNLCSPSDPARRTWD